MTEREALSEYDPLIVAAEEYAANYAEDDRAGIITDVLNAFYSGAAWQARAGRAHSAGEVPREPTEAMIAAGNAVKWGGDVRLIWSDMYSAAPGPWRDQWQEICARPAPQGEK